MHAPTIASCWPIARYFLALVAVMGLSTSCMLPSLRRWCAGIPPAPDSITARERSKIEGLLAKYAITSVKAADFRLANPGNGKSMRTFQARPYSIDVNARDSDWHAYRIGADFRESTATQTLAELKDIIAGAHGLSTWWEYPGCEGRWLCLADAHYAHPFSLSLTVQHEPASNRLESWKFNCQLSPIRPARVSIADARTRAQRAALRDLRRGVVGVSDETRAMVLAQHSIAIPPYSEAASDEWLAPTRELHAGLFVEIEFIPGNHHHQVIVDLVDGNVW